MSWPVVGLVWLIASLLAIPTTHAAPTAAGLVWTVDFASAPHLRSPLRPLHGVNGGPLCYRGTVDLRERHRELGIPLTRLHDTVWVNAEAVDVHTIFRDGRNDPADAASYDFRATDDYAKAVLETGAAVVYRLGESIEHTQNKYWVHPPPDPGKWAAIATGIVRHYQEGWAGGLTNAVRYWEIWNEPDVRPAMWTGTDAQFLELFSATAKSIKTRFPAARVGGPGVGHVGDFVEGRFRPAPFVSLLLRHCREQGVPLDFFSWHRYTDDPTTVERLATAVRSLLDAEGFPRTESHLNEWNYLPDGTWTPMLKDGQGPERDAWYARINGAEGAAFAASVLLRLQDLPVDAANYFTGEIQGFGLFSLSGAPKKTFHAFRAFQDLLQTPVRLPVDGPPHPAPDSPRYPAVAGRNTGASAASFLLAAESSRTPEPSHPLEGALRIVRTPWPGPTDWEILQVNETTDGTVVDAGRFAGPMANLRFRIPTPGVVLIRLRRAP